MIAAWRRGTAAEGPRCGSALAFFSLPTQWLGLMLLILFAGHPADAAASATTSSSTRPGGRITDVLKHMILPSLTLGLVLFGEYTLIVRSAMLETLGEDYVLTARAKGLTPWAIVRKHALRNSLLPITTLIALSLGFIVGGRDPDRDRLLLARHRARRLRRGPRSATTRCCRARSSCSPCRSSSST